MAGRHSRGGRHAWRRDRGAPARSRSRLAEVTDAGTLVGHLMPGVATANRRGRYLTVCGAWVLPASLTGPERGVCARCVRAAL
ncbi:MAG: hypothetical protein ACRDRS_26465 [Pseudonocardiaceae bacterium]